MGDTRAPQTYRTEAVVMRHTRYGEAGRLLTLFTPTYGKLRAQAKGVLRPTSRLAGHLEVLTRSSLLLAHTRTFDLVTQAETMESYAPLRASLPRMSAGLYALELLDQVSEESHESYGQYHLLVRTLAWLAEAPEPDLPLRYFEMQLLEHGGYRPELQTCLHCQQPLRPELNAFSAEAGGCLCAPCGAVLPHARPVTVNALKVLRLLQQGSLPQVKRLRLDAGLSRELEQHLRAYLPHVTERELRTTAFVDAVRASAPRPQSNPIQEPA